MLEAPWIGVPLRSWPGLDLTPGPEFWALLPAFVVVTIVGAIETIGDGVAIQRVSRRRPRGDRFPSGAGRPQRRRRGQPALRHRRSAPNTTYSSSVSLAEVTGVAARRVGVVIGVVFVGLAFFPKVAALLIAIPGPVAAAYVTVLIALLFVQA